MEEVETKCQNSFTFHEFVSLDLNSRVCSKEHLHSPMQLPALSIVGINYMENCSRIFDRRNQ
ncbi:predicted protein [Botrytis cinerea T4]|uniref:Uncharacterized protein n=1 Tax=Botryotinia fuckeliana (strain T4) TaxID=999810 RepID=G2YYN8_BOTF4|nr:predicted protein [Botrytis cinerea T4]